MRKYIHLKRAYRKRSIEKFGFVKKKPTKFIIKKYIYKYIYKSYFKWSLLEVGKKNKILYFIKIKLNKKKHYKLGIKNITY